MKRLSLLMGVMLVTDRKACSPGRTLKDEVAGALAGGARIVQLREKDLCARELLSLAMELRALTKRFNAGFVVNDRVDIALLSMADGVHLGQNGFPPADAKRVLGGSIFVGVSTHSAAEALRAEQGGADYITLGPVYHTPSKAAYGEPLGIERFKEAALSVSIPVYAIGGIKRENVRKVQSDGAKGVAVISAILGTIDTRKSAGELVRELSL